MGYRSEVALAISKKVMPHFLSVLAKEPEVRTMVFKHHDKLVRDYDGEGTLFVHWSDIKLYDSYPEVQAINSFVEDLEGDVLDGFELPEGEDQGDHIRFVRLGEDVNDSEEKGNLHMYDIGFSRTLSF